MGARGDAMRGRAFLNLAVLALAMLAGGCTLDDSGPVRSVFRPENGKSAYLRVVYLTDRAPDATAAGGFGHQWADAPSCGAADAVLPPARISGEADNWGYITKTTPAACAGPGGSVGGAVALIAAEAKAKHCNSVFLFVHGFHTGFDGAVLRAAQIAHDAQAGCAIAAFTWSSAVELDRYAADLEHSAYAEPLLGEFLRELSESGLRVTVLGHSMGGRMTLATLSAIARGREKVRPGFIDELVLAAADVGIEKGDDDFANLMRDAAPFAKRTTIYASGGDAVLEISKGAHGGVTRLGREPLADLAYQANDATHIVDVIDATPVPADLLDHSYFAMSYEALYDMTLTLRGVPLADRLKPNGAWPPTLVTGENGGNTLATKRSPRLISRILIKLVPLLP
jgi:esterase/lipase superfamily enzyme